MKILLMALLLSFLFLKAKAQHSTLACSELENLQMAMNETISEENKIEIERTAHHYCGFEDAQIRIGMTLQYSNGQIAVDMLGVEGATWYLPDGQEIENDFSKALFLDRKVAPILAPFKKYHKVCSGGCDYISWGIWGDEAHKKRPSCHNSGEAIDIHAVVCAKTTYKAKTTKFQNYLKCMRKHFGVIHGNAEHKNHAHIQLKNCKKIKLK